MDSMFPARRYTVRRKVLKVVGGAFRVRDEWHVLDGSDNVTGVLLEDSTGGALLRRFLSNLIPQRYDVFMPDEVSGTKVASMDQAFNPFVYRLLVDFSFDPRGRLDRRVGIAASILLAAAEGRQG